MLSSDCVKIGKRAVSSTNASPILFIVFLEGVKISRHLNFFETDKSMGSSASVQMHDEAPDPYPLPKILLNVVEKYVLSDIPCLVLSLYIMFWSISHII